MSGTGLDFTKRVFRVAAALLALGVMVGALATGSAAGQQTVSECQVLSTQGQTYELNQSITNSTIDTCLEITADDVVLDGQGHRVDGVNKTSLSEGILVNGSKNVTVKNFGNVTRWADGIRPDDGSDNATLTNNTANNNSGDGIEVGFNSDNATLTDNIANNNNMGIRVGTADNPTLTNNTANNNRDGIQVAISENPTLTDNTANNNDDDDGIAIRRSNDSTLTDNTANNNGRYGITVAVESLNATLTDNTANDNNNAGITLEDTESNNLTDNTANDNGQYGIWLRDGSNLNNLTDNLAENNNVAGIYLGGFQTANGNTLVNNTARGSDYGIWVRNSVDNEVSESLAEGNDIGIEFEEDAFGFSSLAESGNTFTNDTSRGNTLDFVVQTLGSSNNLGLESVSALPVTNLDIGASTNPNTKLSFNANDMGLKSVTSPASDPADRQNIGRYFEAATLQQIFETQDDGGSITPQSGVPFLNVSLHYEDPGDLGTVDETTLELRRFNGTASEWQTVPGSTRDTANDIVSANITTFSDFGAFGEPRAGVRECIDRRNLGRGQEDQECPFDRTVDRGGSREGLDRNTGRGGDETHRDSATSRRSRSRGSGRSR